MQSKLWPFSCMSVYKDPVIPLGCSANVNVQDRCAACFPPECGEEGSLRSCEGIQHVAGEGPRVELFRMHCGKMVVIGLAVQAHTNFLEMQAMKAFWIVCSAQEFLVVFERHTRKCLLKSFLNPFPGSALVAFPRV